MLYTTSIKLQEKNSKKCTMGVQQVGEIMRKYKRGFFIGKINKTAVITAVVVLLLITTIVYGNVIANRSEIKFINNMKTGSVDVKIDLYEVNEKGETMLRPGQIEGDSKISCIPRVTNLREESYVRVKADIKKDKESIEPLTMESVYGLDEDWIKRGNYFYYKKIMKPMESVDIFSGIQISQEWKEDITSEFKIQLTVDAIQASNFSPDFGSVAPWGMVQIQKAKETDHIVYRTVESVTDNTMKFTSASGLESNTDDLFGNFTHFMAGNSFRDTLKMENKSKNPIKLSFCTETDIQEKTDNEAKLLLEQTVLEIYCDEELLYHGSLNTVPLYRYKDLTVLKSGEKKNFNFKITLPAGAENMYSVLTNHVIWKFKAEKPITESNGSVDISISQTGDENDFTVYFVVALLAVMVMILLIILGRRDKKREKDD